MPPKSPIPDYLQNTAHSRESSEVSTVGSLIDVVLPWVGAHRFEDDAMAPAVGGRRRGSGNSHPVSLWTRSSRGTRHSISSIESYMSDSSIDAALSTMRLGQSTTSVQSSDVPLGTSPNGAGVVSMRRSVSTGGSSRSRFAAGGNRLLDDDDSSFLAMDPEMANHISGRTNPAGHHTDVAHARNALADEDDTDPIDAYYYRSSSAARSSSETGRTRRSHSSNRSSALPPSSYTRPRHTRRSESITSYGGVPDDQFALKVIYPSNTDCTGVALRIPRSCTFEEFQDKLNIKLRTAEGLDLAMLHKGFRIGHRPATSERRNSILSSSDASSGRPRSQSVSSNSGSVIDPATLTIIKNLEEWSLAIPRGKEKLTLYIVVDN